MFEDNDYQEPASRGDGFDESPAEEWDDMLDLLDHADRFQSFDTPGTCSEPVSNFYAVLRLIFRKENPRSNWRSWIEGTPKVYRRDKAGASVRPYSFTGRERDSVLFWPKSGQNSIDLVSWQPAEDPYHQDSHPESRAVKWLHRQGRINPGFAGSISQVKMMIQGQPCNTCLTGLKSSLGQILPSDSHVQIKWVKPDPKKRFQFFWERRYQPKIMRWHRG